MRTFIQASVIAFALLLSRQAGANDLSFTLIEPDLQFGPAGAVFGSFGFQDLFLDGTRLETPWLSDFQGTATFASGPMQVLTVDNSDPDFTRSHYEFGPGTWTLTVFWFDQFGTPMQGHYVAPLLGLEVDVTCEDELSAVDCGGAFDDSNGEMFASFGPGLFGPDLAAVLRLKRPGGPFSFALDLDGITGNPSDPLRLAGSPAGQLTISIPVEVPEPSILSLLLLAPVLGRRFRRRGEQGSRPTP